MTTLDARETLPFLGIEGETRHSPQLGKGVSIVLIDRRPLTQQCLSRWLQEGSPDLRVVSVGSPADLLDASRSLSAPIASSSALAPPRSGIPRCSARSPCCGAT